MSDEVEKMTEGEAEEQAEQETAKLEDHHEETPAAVSEELQQEVEQLRDQALRNQAEMQNLRRRAEQDVEKAHKFALEKFVRELLPVIDSLEKSVEACAAAEGESLSAIREGVEMTLSMFNSTFDKFSVEAINPEGAPFDPQQHEAMSMVDAPGAEPNSVVAVIQKGYTLNGRLVRPAMVMVSKASSPPIDEQA